MEIILSNTGRRFNKEWIFRGMNYRFQSGDRIGIIGGNGSGKSTLLQLISGFLVPSEGTIRWNEKETSIEAEKIFRHTSLASPFLELYEEYTAKEAFVFHAGLKPMRNKLTAEEFEEILQLENIRNKPLRNYSSGMKQRVKLALAILSNTPLLLLDEPCSNLDHKAIEWYKQLLMDHSSDRIVIVSSNNNSDELFLCTSQLSVEDYK